jgi:methylated-DNA-[protein]-cysteine S-methyltransferase
VDVRHVRYDAAEWGTGELWLRGSRLVHHELPTPGGTGDEDPAAVPFAAYFRGERVSFDGIELELDGASEFGIALTAALRAVPYGETVTYAELAALAGRPGAQRAAGTFCARNRFPLVVPCHRVVSSTGVGPYGSLGTSYKRALLTLERAL